MAAQSLSVSRTKAYDMIKRRRGVSHMRSAAMREAF